MEAVPRLPMLWFPLKTSPEGTSFSSLKKYIAECYQENPESFSKEVHSLESLRNAAMRPTKDVSGCATLKRYYCQLHSLSNRFPQVLERQLFLFSWKDLYASSTSEITDFRYEMAAVLFNIAGHHTQLGASVDRVDVDGMKLACTHFQIAAWSYGELRDKYEGTNGNGDFMAPEMLLFMQQVSFAHAQECILEKSLLDNRKPAIVAKVTAQILSYYGAALAALLSGGDDGSIADVVGNSVFKQWKKYVRFKIAYLNCILFLYQGQQAEEQQKMGERVTLYQAAWDSLEEARKESKGLDNQTEIMEALTFTADVVEGKRKAAKNENEFIYHEAVPELKDIPAVQGANLVNGINFSVTDPEVAGEDIFARLIPMKAHEASSMYSEEKANLLRQIGSKVQEKDGELDIFMSSLNVENLNVSEERANKIPQGIVDRCASINAKPNAIPDLISSMSNLAEICADVETNLKEIKDLLSKEDINEKKFQQESGVHRNNAHFAELTREFHKYLEAHQKAGDSNDTLRRAMELHVNNLRVLAKPLQDIQQSVPKLSGEIKEEMFRDLKLILNKVNEMKAQRAQFCADLRIAINDDDITSQIIAFGEEGDVKELFSKEIAKHNKLVSLTEQNLKAQDNILAALTEHYAKVAPILKTINDVKHKRDNFFSSLAASYDVYEDLLAKSAKGLEFYKKLQGNVQKLLARVKAACDVQNEERQQRMSSTSRLKPSNNASLTASMTTAKSTAPKLKDYLKAGKIISSDSTFIPPIRPSPLGSEATSSSACIPSNSSYYTAQSQMPHIAHDYPPPPYTPPTQQYYETNGYTNPIYQPNAAMNLDYNFSAYDPPSQYSNQLPMYTNVASSASASGSTHSIQPTSSVTTNHQSYQYPSASEQAVNMMYQTNKDYTHNVLMTDLPPSYSNQNVNYIQAYQQTAQQQSPHQSGQQNSQSQQQTWQFQNHSHQTHYQQQSLQAQQLQFQQQVRSSQVPPIPPASAFSSITTKTSQTPAQSSWTPLAAANAFENLSIPGQCYQTSEIANPAFPSTWHSTVNQTHSTPSSTEHAPYNPSGMQAPNVAPTTMNTWNTSGSNTLSQATSQLNSATASYPTYKNIANQVQISDTQNEAILQQQQQIEFIQSHAKASSIYGVQPQAFMPQSAGEVDHQNTSQQNTSYTPYMAPTITSTADSTSISSIAAQAYNSQYQTMTETISTPQNVSQLPRTSDGSNQGVVNTVANHYNAAISYQQSYDIPYSTNVGESSQTMPAQQQFNNTMLANPANYIQNIVQAPTTPSPVSKQAANSTAGKKQGNKPKPSKNTSNIDLLSEIDFSANLPMPALQPQVATSKNDENSTTGNLDTSKAPSLVQTPSEPLAPISPQKIPEKAVVMEALPTALAIASIDRKPSCDNISLCSDLSSLADHSFEWDSVSLRGDQHQSNAGPRQAVNENMSGNDPPLRNALDDPKTLKYFHKEVERYERMMESLNVKMLNGNTPLVNKWKELQDLLVRDEAKRTISIARLFPEKNRSTDCIPFDHARVVLERSTDDYINAAYVKDLGPGCPTFILAQTPLQNTVNDFWSMIWSQKTRTVVCLHTPNEILDPFWPSELNKEMHFDDFSVTLVKQFDLSHCTELNLKLALNGADAILDLSLIQIKTWTKSSPSQLLGIAQNILIACKQRNQEFNSNAPLIMNCITGSERSGLVALAICAILATQTKRPILINVGDVWHRICSQRKSALRDTNNLELSMQIVLSHGHDLLNKRGILTSYQMKNIPKATLSEKEEVKDPLNDLDPLWKLKPKQ